MKPAPEHPWPPLICSAKVPWFIRVRDWFLTLLAWLFLAFALRLGLLLLWDYFSYPVFELTRIKTPDWTLVWERLSPFVYMILAVVTWIIAWGVKRRSQLRRTFDPRRLTPPLPLEEHAASLGLDPREIERWRQWRIVTVYFDGNRIATARPGGPEDAVEDPRSLPPDGS
jgi:poly-beta-1,6-N-acetyl-D-glucosamine biosynthesis protein PgaD